MKRLFILAMLFWAPACDPQPGEDPCDDPPELDYCEEPVSGFCTEQSEAGALCEATFDCVVEQCDFDDPEFANCQITCRETAGCDALDDDMACQVGAGDALSCLRDAGEGNCDAPSCMCF